MTIDHRKKFHNSHRKRGAHTPVGDVRERSKQCATVILELKMLRLREDLLPGNHRPGNSDLSK